MFEFHELVRKCKDIQQLKMVLHAMTHHQTDICGDNITMFPPGGREMKMTLVEFWEYCENSEEVKG